MTLSRIWQYVSSVIGYWQFWIAVAFMLERSLERYFPQFTVPLNVRFPAERRRRIFIAIAVFAFVYANFKVFDDVNTKLEDANRANNHAGGAERWPALTTEEAAALRIKLRGVPPATITVACESLNCKDLADGIADIFGEAPGWKVTKLHRGGFDITGVSGIRVEPHEPATEKLRDAIEASTKLKVDIVDESREQMNSTETFMVVGSRPF
jgi:hypothetical protein